MLPSLLQTSRTAPRSHRISAVEVLYESEISRVERVNFEADNSWTDELLRLAAQFDSQAALPIARTALIRKQLLSNQAEEQLRYRQEFRVNRSLNRAKVVRSIGHRHGDRAETWFVDHGGVSLAQHLQRGAALTARLDLALAFTQALQSLHDDGFAHRDVNPFNAIVAGGSVLLIDLGLAHPLSEVAPQTHAVGTLPYQAPEQSGRFRRRIDVQTDLYSLGITLYEILTGKLPLYADSATAWTHAHLLQVPTDPRRYQPELSDALVKLLTQLLAKQPKARGENTQWLVHELMNCPEYQHLQATREPTSRPALPTIQPWRSSDQQLLEREAALSEFRRAFEGLATNRGSIIHLVGAPGSGRTALLNEIRHQGQAGHVLWAEVSADESELAQPLPPLMQLTRQWLQQLLARPVEDQQRWQQQLNPRVAELLAELQTWMPELASLMHFSAELSPTTRDREAALPSVLIAELQTAFRDFPRVAVIRGDTKEQGSAYSSLLQQLPAPIILISVSDNDDSNELHDIDHPPPPNVPSSRIVLAPLSIRATRTLLARWCHRQDEGLTALATHLHGLIGGYPGLLAEALEQMWEAGVIRPGANGELTVDDQKSISINLTGAARAQVLTQRWQSFDGDLRRFISIAACIGDDFDQALLRAINAQAETQLTKAARLGIVVRNAVDEQLAWRFSDVQWVMLGLRELSTLEAKSIHRRIADCLIDGRHLEPRLHRPIHRDGPRLLKAAQHLNESVSLDDEISEQERRRMARMNLNAGAIAQRIGQHRLAHRLYRFGLAVLVATRECARELDDSANELADRLLLACAETALMLDDHVALATAIARKPELFVGTAASARARWLAAVLDAREGTQAPIAVWPIAESTAAPALPLIETVLGPRDLELPPSESVGDVRWQDELFLFGVCQGRSWLSFTSPQLNARMSTPLTQLSWLQTAEQWRMAERTIANGMPASAARIDQAALTSPITATFWFGIVRDLLCDDNLDHRSEFLQRSMQRAVAQGQFITAAVAAAGYAAELFWWEPSLAAHSLQLTRVLANLSPAMSLPGHTSVLYYQHSILRARGMHAHPPSARPLSVLDQLHCACLQLLLQLMGNETNQTQFLPSQFCQKLPMADLHNALLAVIALRQADTAQAESALQWLPNQGRYGALQLWVRGELAMERGAWREGKKLLDRARRARLPLPIRALIFESLNRLPDEYRPQAPLLAAHRLWQHWGASERCRDLERRADLITLLPIHRAGHTTAHLTSVLTAIRRVSETLNLSDLLNTACELLAELTGADLTYFALADPQVDTQTQGEMTVRSNRTNVDIPWPAIRYVANSSRSIGVNDAALLRTLFGDQTNLALLATPLKESGSGRSVLVAQRLDSNFSLVDEEALTLFATHLGTVLRNARLYDAAIDANKAYEQLFDAADQGFIQARIDGTLLRANPALASMLAFNDTHQLLTHRPTLASLLADPHEHQRLMENLHASAICRTTTAALRRDGSTVFISLQVRLDGSDRLFGSILDVSEREQRQQAELARRSAEATLAARAEFLAHMSHEIRTPLNAIVGFTRLGLETKQSAQRLDHLRRVDTASRQLLGLLNDVLDLAKIDAGRLEFEAAPLDLRALLRELSSVYSLQAQTKGLQLKTEFSLSLPEGYWVKGDALRLRQILFNLVSNAIKFTHQGSVNVQISGDCVGETAEVRIKVTDTGIGMTVDQLDRVFDSFSQASAGITRQYGGTGLGLAIVKRLIEQMGGDIDATSIPNQGSQFSVRLYLSLSQRVRNKRNKPSFDLSNARVLVVDDNALNRTLLNELLTNRSTKVHLAESGASALQAAATATFDAVLMDIHMPDMDGIETTRRLRSLSAVPVIALTADISRVSADSHWFSAQLSKPVDPEALFAALAQVLGRRPEKHPKQKPRKATVKALNWSAALRHHGNNKTLLLNMLGAFQQHYRDAGTRMLAFKQQQDWQGLEQLAHSLRGVAGSFGMASLQACCGAIEDAMRTRHTTHLESMIDSFNQALTQALSASASRIQQA